MTIDGSIRILSGFEEERDRAWLDDALSEAGVACEIILARGSAEIRATLREREIDCVVLGGPRYSSALDVVGELRMAGVETPVLLLTRGEQVPQSFALLGAGVVEVLPALDPMRLLESLARCVRLGRAERRAAAANAKLERQRAILLGLGGIASELVLASSVEELAESVVTRTRELIGAHQAVITIAGEDGPIRKASFSDKYAGWRAAQPRWTVPGLEPQGLSERLTQAELEADPRHGKAGGASGRVPSRGWLAAVLTGGDGTRIGTLVLSDRQDGDFEEQDEASLLEIAALASARIDNLRLRTVRQGRGEPELAERVIDEFLATLSHELRTPLQSILGWARLLASGTLPPERVARAVEVIERNARAQARMVEDVLDASSMRSGTLRIVRRLVGVSAFVSSAVEQWRAAAAAKHIRLSVEIPNEVGTVQGDPVRLRQVVGNLLANAVEFTPEYGSISVVVERGEHDLSITVSDNGPGIPPEFIPVVFDRFRQADGSFTRSHRGLGIGLTIVRRLVELHGGEVGVQSDAEGTSFSVCLPLAEQAAPPEREAESRAPETMSGEFHTRSLEGKRVLLVEDERDTRELLASVLSEHGAVVCSAASAVEGFERLASFQPDLLLSDIGMPGEDGCSFLRRVRLSPDERIRSVVAVALSAYTRLEDRRRALAAGYQLYLTKPADPAQLVRQLRSLLTPSLTEALGA